MQEKNNTNSEEDHSGPHPSRVEHLSLSSYFGNVRWCPSLAVGSLFKATSDPQSVAVSFRLGSSSLFCLASFPSAQGPGVVHLMSESTTSTTPTCLQRGPLVQSGGWNPWITPRRHFREGGGSISLSPILPHVLVCPRLFPIMYGF